MAGNKNTKLQSDNVKTQSDLFASLLSKVISMFVCYVMIKIVWCVYVPVCVCVVCVALCVYLYW